MILDWFIRFSFGLAFLAYYALVGVQSFLTARGYALASLLSIVNSVTNSSLPNSTSSCETYALNTAFAFPPVGCSDCVVGNFSGAPSKRSPEHLKRFGVYRMFEERSGGMRLKSLDDARQRLHDLTVHTERFESSCVNPGGVDIFTTPNPFTLPPGKNNSLVVTQTNPPVALTCSNPTPTCFDVGCSGRAFWNELYNVIFLAGNFLNSLVQDWDIGFPFFTTGNVPKCSYMCPTVNASAPCSTTDTCPGVNYSLEQSVVDVITGATAFATCFCNTINEVLPITGNNVTYTCRPDVCCAVTKYGDLNAGVALILIRGFKSLTIGNLPLTPGGSPFPYFTTGPFLDDINSLFEIAFGLTLCVGNMVRSVFQVANLGALDIYCVVQNSSAALLLMMKMQIEIIVSLGTILYPQGNAYFVDPDCNWSATGCLPNVNNTGFIKSADAVLDAIFGRSGGVCSRSFGFNGQCPGLVPTIYFADGWNSVKYVQVPLQSKGQGLGGVTTCLCTLLNSIIPIRSRPTEPLSDTNCPLIDLCCGLRHLSFGLRDLFKFSIRLLATSWQRWETLSGVPYPPALYAYWFCNEFATPFPAGCGRVNPFMQEFTAVLNSCFCQMFQLIDVLMSNSGFQGFRCFCGSEDAVFCSSGQIIYVLGMQLISLTRRFVDRNYWIPCAVGGAAGGGNLNFGEFYVIECTWSYNFFRPFLQLTCSTTGSLSCFVNALYNVCPYQVRMVFQSATIYPVNLAITFIGAIEGFIRMFARYACGDNPLDNPGPTAFGLNAKCAGMALTQLAGMFINMYIADGNIACRTGGRDRECACWKDAVPGYSYFFYDSPVSNVNGLGPFQGRPPQRCVLAQYATSTLTTNFFTSQCCNGTAIPAAGCPSYNATRIPPTCLPICPTIPSPCVQVYPELPTCDSGIVGSVPVDGLLMAVCRFIRCGIVNLLPPAASTSAGAQAIQLKNDPGVWDAMIGFLSVVWQLSVALVSWGMTAVIWLLSLGITTGIVLFIGTIISLLFPPLAPAIQGIQIAMQIAFLFGAIIGALITAGPITTNSEIINSTFIPTVRDATMTGAPQGHSVPWKRWWNMNGRSEPRMIRDPHLSTWASFEAYTNAVTANRTIYDEDKTPYAQLLADLFFGYYTSDCATDIRACACRNLNMGDLCKWNITTEHVEPPTVTQAQVQQYLAREKFNGTTNCDYLVTSLQWANDMSVTERVAYSECLEKRAMGERINAMMKFVPPDAIMQGWSALPGILRTVYTLVGEQNDRELRNMHIPEDFDADPDLSMQRHEEQLMRFKNDLHTHTHRARMARSLVPGTKEELTCIDRQHLTYDPLYTKMAEYEFKWKSGYASTLFKRVRMNFNRMLRQDPVTGPSMWTSSSVGESFTDMCVRHASQVGSALVRLPSVFNTFTMGSMATVTMMTEHGTNLWTKIVEKHTQLRAHAARSIHVPDNLAEFRTDTWNLLEQTPVYRWYLNESASPFPTTVVSREMSEHLSRLYRERKEHAQQNPEDASSVFNAYGIPQHLNRIYSHLYDRYVRRFNIETDALHRVKRVYYQVYDTLYPGYLTEEQHKRFILDDNCPIVKRSVDLMVKTVQRCAAKASNQTQNFADNSLRDKIMRQVVQVTGSTLPSLLKDMRRTPQEVEDTSLRDSIYPPTDYEWKTWNEVVGAPPTLGGNHWRRPRRIQRVSPTPSPSEAWRNLTHKRHFRPRTPVDNFNLITWILDVFDSIFGTNLAGNLATFFYDLQAFVLNNSTNPKDFPNFGLKGWFNFFIECDFDTNLDCSTGIGLEAAFGYVSVGFLLAFIVVPFVFPSIISVLAATGIFLLYIIIVGVLAFGWSPR